MLPIQDHPWAEVRNFLPSGFHPLFSLPSTNHLGKPSPPSSHVHKILADSIDGYCSRVNWPRTSASDTNEILHHGGAESSRVPRPLIATFDGTRQLIIPMACVMALWGISKKTPPPLVPIHRQLGICSQKRGTCVPSRTLPSWIQEQPVACIAQVLEGVKIF